MVALRCRNDRVTVEVDEGSLITQELIRVGAKKLGSRVRVSDVKDAGRATWKLEILSNQFLILRPNFWPSPIRAKRRWLASSHKRTMRARCPVIGVKRKLRARRDSNPQPSDP